MSEAARSLDAWIVEFAEAYKSEQNLSFKKDISREMIGIINGASLPDEEKRKYISLYKSLTGEI